jgi:hypothetical protein
MLTYSIYTRVRGLFPAPRLEALGLVWGTSLKTVPVFHGFHDPNINGS